MNSSYCSVNNFKKALFALTMLLGLNLSYGQELFLHASEADFGEVEITAMFKAGFVAENKGNQKIFIMRADAPSNLLVNTSKRVLNPGDTALIQLTYTPTSTGKFQETASIFYSTSSQPMKVQIKGTLQRIERNNLTACVNFSPKMASGSALIPASVERTFYFSDAVDGKRIAEATLVAYRLDGEIPATFNTSNSQIKASLTPGRYRFEAISEGYLPQVTEMYIGYTGNNHTFVLSKANPQEDKLIKDESAAAVTLRTLPPEQEGELSQNLYAPNNIILVIDISRSMREENRLNLLQKNIGKMLEPLRAIDTITVITYADEVKTLVPAQSASTKKEIRQKTDSLVAKGATAGSQAIRVAYEMAEQHYIPGGNNLILLASDGIFRLNKTDKIMIEQAASRNSKPIFLSVVGLGTNRNTLQSLREITALGKGTFLHLQEESNDADALLEEIKRRSLRR